MKNLLPLFTLLLFFTACNQKSTSDNNRNIQLLTDSTVYHNNNIYTDTLAGQNTEVAEQNTPQVTSKPAKVKQVTYTSSKKATVKTVPQVSKQDNAIPPVSTPPIVNNSGSDTQKGNETVSTGNSLPDAGVPGEVKKAEKKGWNKATQGAVIGGAAGAVGGAIISKKKGLGAVIGGVVGAAGGYIIGKNKDKKEAANH